MIRGGINMSNRPPIPEGVKRKLRQEAYFGCVKCGCPIIEYHHIEPWSMVKKHEADNLVVLCPNCHREANVGAYYKEQVIADKKEPFNKRTRLVQNDFMLRKLDDIKVKIGGAEISHARSILTVRSIPLIFFNKTKDGRALLNAIFFDNSINPVAIIKDNEWTTFLNRDMWDIRYSPGHLIINLEQKKIFLDLKIKGNIIFLKMRQRLFGNDIKVTEEKLQINKCIMINCILDGGGIRID